MRREARGRQGSVNAAQGGRRRRRGILLPGAEASCQRVDWCNLNGIFPPGMGNSMSCESKAPRWTRANWVCHAHLVSSGPRPLPAVPNLSNLPWNSYQSTKAGGAGQVVSLFLSEAYRSRDTCSSRSEGQAGTRANSPRVLVQRWCATHPTLPVQVQL